MTSMRKACSQKCHPSVAFLFGRKGRPRALPGMIVQNHGRHLAHPERRDADIGKTRVPLQNLRVCWLSRGCHDEVLADATRITGDLRLSSTATPEGDAHRLRSRMRGTGGFTLVEARFCDGYIVAGLSVASRRARSEPACIRRNEETQGVSAGSSNVKGNVKRRNR